MVEGKRYSGVAMALHWIIAIAVIAIWRIAEAAEHAGTREESAAIMVHHKALGITVLVLTLIRLAWRLSHKAPPLPDNYASWERVLARSVHVIFYVMLIGLPLGAWLATSFYGSTIDYWGLFTVPALPVGENPDAGKAIFGLHKTGGSILIYLIGLHILGALKHMVVDKDGTLWRMLPFGPPRN